MHSCLKLGGQSLQRTVVVPYMTRLSQHIHALIIKSAYKRTDGLLRRKHNLARFSDPQRIGGWGPSPPYLPNGRYSKRTTSSTQDWETSVGTAADHSRMRAEVWQYRGLRDTSLQPAELGMAELPAVSMALRGRQRPSRCRPQTTVHGGAHVSYRKQQLGGLMWNSKCRGVSGGYTSRRSLSGRTRPSGVGTMDGMVATCRGVRHPAESAVVSPFQSLRHIEAGAGAVGGEVYDHLPQVEANRKWTLFFSLSRK